jgi:hypothetical protein
MRYAALVSRSFAAPLVRVVAETPRWSAYHVAGAACRVEFAVGGESRLPVAVASMTAKYVRELAMRAFNAWWCGRAPGLAATAGYPLDAARWRRDAAAAVEAAGLGIAGSAVTPFVLRRVAEATGGAAEAGADDAAARHDARSAARGRSILRRRRPRAAARRREDREAQSQSNLRTLALPLSSSDIL